MASKVVKIAVASVGAIGLFGGATFLFIKMKQKQSPPITAPAEGSENPPGDKDKSGTTDGKATEGETPDVAAKDVEHDKDKAKNAKTGDAAEGDKKSGTAAGIGDGPDSGASSTPADATGSGRDVSFRLPSPYTESQLSTLLQQLESSKTDLDRRTAVADLRDATLERMRADLDDRREELTKLRDQIVSREKDLDDKKGRFDGEIVRLSAAEEKNLKDVALVYEEMAADAAAERLVALGTGEAAKILARVSSKKAAKVIAAMPVDKASEVTARLGKILPVPSDVTPANEGK